VCARAGMNTCMRAELPVLPRFGVSYLVPEAETRAAAPLRALAVQRHLGVIRRRPVRIRVCARGRLESHEGGARRTVWHEGGARPVCGGHTHARTYWLSHAPIHTRTHTHAHAYTHGGHAHARTHRLSHAHMLTCTHKHTRTNIQIHTYVLTC
jgi:hypothetical protein